MVWLKQTMNRSFYICSECGLGYEDPKTALMCEDYCRKNHSCSREIAEKAVHREE